MFGRALFDRFSAAETSFLFLGAAFPPPRPRADAPRNTGDGSQLPFLHMLWNF